jgi:type IX secretion system PorP/SprF family membrane protein
MRPLLIILFVITATQLQAQQRPPYSHFFLNPYYTNPAIAGTAGSTEIHLNHRRQWIGIDGAPVVSGVTFHTSFDNNLSFGVNGYNYSRGLISTTSLLPSIGYSVDLGRDQRLAFGLAVGGGSNGFNINEASNPNDQALLNNSNSYFFMDGQFGISYQNQGLNIGFALPQLLSRGVTNENTFNRGTIEPTQQMVGHASYRITIPDARMAIIPYAWYSLYDSLQNQFEAGLTAQFNDLVYAGGGYRQNYGPQFMLGFRINNDISVGYAYELAGEQAESIGQGTHEVHLSFRFPKRKKEPVTEAEPEKDEEVLAKKEPAEEQKPEPDAEQSTGEPANQENGAIVVNDLPENEPDPEPEPEPAPEPPAVRLQMGNHPKEMQPGFYVISGVFSSAENAEKQIERYRQANYPADYAYVSEKGYYYVYIYRGNQVQETRSRRNEFRTRELFSDAWLLEIYP